MSIRGALTRTLVFAVALVGLARPAAADHRPGTIAALSRAPIGALRAAANSDGSRPRELGDAHGRVDERVRSGVPGIDSLANFVDQFQADGFDSHNNPKSIWPYSMVGAAPETNRSTRFDAAIIPVTIQLVDAAGNVVAIGGHPLELGATPDIVGKLLQSPIYEDFTYTSGTGQYTDQLMRAQFWSRIRHHGDEDEGYHNVLRPSVKTLRVIKFPVAKAAFVRNGDGTCCQFMILDFRTFVNLLFPATAADTTTPIGAAEHAGEMTTRGIATLLFNNIYLADIADIQHTCCVLGFHAYDLEPGDARNGNREKRYVMNYASWISNGLFSGGFEDITAASHEMAEIFADPFVDNETPWWLSLDPFSSAALCQNNLENGDVVEVLSSNAVFPTSLHNRTYHPQNLALLSWFAFESPSTARLHAYSFPDETTLTELSPHPLLGPNCTVP